MGIPFSTAKKNDGLEHSPDTATHEFPKNKCLKQLTSYEKMFIEGDDKNPFPRQMIVCRVDPLYCAVVKWANVCEDISQISMLHDPKLKYDFWIHNNGDSTALDSQADAKRMKRLEEFRAEIKKEMDDFENACSKTAKQFNVFFVANPLDPGFSLHFAWRGNEFARALVRHCNRLITSNTHLDLKDYFPDETIHQLELTSSTDSGSDEETANKNDPNL